MMDYASFLASKQRTAPEVGRQVTSSDVHPILHPWQAEIVAWAVRTGRAAIWADTGLGKTMMQLEWARLSGSTALVVAPLAVCAQTVREAGKLGIGASYVRSATEITGPGVWVTNFHPVPRRLSCTATPAPNDPEELTNQAEFLGVMSRVEMLAAYFVHDSDAGWRLKGHARGPMFRWMASWAVAIRMPSDFGYPDKGYVLPGLMIREHLLDVDAVPDGQLFATDLGGVGGRVAVRKATLRDRVDKVVELVTTEPAEPWVLWCGLNDEADLLASLLPGSVNVHGSLSPDDKADLLMAFADGTIPYLITKPSIASMGLNWQHCARMAFVGLSDSYEAYYQAIRRCYRYGQPRVVHAHIVLSALEGQIAANVRRKEVEAGRSTAELVAAIRSEKEELVA